ncbi:hypothetical protein ACYPKM_00895 [Pseudomonas aeruginosa]
MTDARLAVITGQPIKADGAFSAWYEKYRRALWKRVYGPSFPSIAKREPDEKWFKEDANMQEAWVAGREELAAGLSDLMTLNADELNEKYSASQLLAEITERFKRLGYEVPVPVKD